LAALIEFEPEGTAEAIGDEDRLRELITSVRSGTSRGVPGSIDHDLLDEIPIHFRDFWDQILSGPWLNEVLREEQLQIRQHFRTRARLVFKTKVV
jgi:hypothetical protein